MLDERILVGHVGIDVIREVESTSLLQSAVFARRDRVNILVVAIRVKCSGYPRTRGGCPGMSVFFAVSTFRHVPFTPGALPALPEGRAL